MGASQEKAYIRFNRHGKPYLVQRSVIGGTRKEHWTPIAGIDRQVLEAALRVKDDVQQEAVEVPCTNPLCKNTILMTKKQLEEFFISSKKRYDLMIFPFCCTACRDKVLAEHGGALDGVDKS